MELLANFTLNNDSNIDALFQIDSQLTVVGQGLIDVVTAGGKATVTSKTFVFEQGIASDTWVIIHNLNKHPSVSLVDSAGTQFTAKVHYDSDIQCTVYINGETTGKAYLN